MGAKVYVAVVARFSPEGELCPLSLEWEDGRIYKIDRVTDVRRAASLKAGGAGIRYTIETRGRTTYLFLEENRWFVIRNSG